jgi:hypothetical protein
LIPAKLIGAERMIGGRPIERDAEVKGIRISRNQERRVLLLWVVIANAAVVSRPLTAIPLDPIVGLSG